MSERKGTKALEIWCRRLVKDCSNPNVQIENMTTSWRNGLAFCALIHHFRPDLIDVSTLKPENVYENNKLAFSLAEKHLGIPSLLDPEDMVANEVPDRLSILTYLSQFYQRLGHTVQKVSETGLNPSSPSTTKTTPIKFGKTNLDKCAACNLPVYLAQRLIVSQKLYHRRCFRCSKCSGLLNTKNFESAESCGFLCESCKNEKALASVFNMDQMGMLAFDDQSEDKTDTKENEPIKTNKSSVLEKISIFEKKIDIPTDNLDKLSIRDDSFSVDTRTMDDVSTSNTIEKKSKEIENNEVQKTTYKSDINKSNFLKSQLQENDNVINKNELEEHELKLGIRDSDRNKNKIVGSDIDIIVISTKYKNESNVTDDIRLAKSLIKTSPVSGETTKNELESTDSPKNESTSNTNNVNNTGISVPPRKKKSLPRKVQEETIKQDKPSENLAGENYPDHLNPFSDVDEEEEPKGSKPKVSTNPFGSSSDEEDEVQKATHEKPKASNGPTPTPTKRLISANPFWSDDEEPLSEEENHIESSNMYKSQIATSTPNLPSNTPRKKGRAPPPPVITVQSHLGDASTSLDDIASISSYSSYNSTAYSDQKSVGKITPRSKKKHLVPQPDSISAKSCGGSTEHGVDSIGRRTSTPDGGARRTKGPAPGLPLPERREVKLQISPQELQVQLDLLETQQLGLERQGVLIEQMIRDKCEGEAAATVPQEEVEDLVIQLCELVNEKNDLFRKQTELMYIRRQQRLEQEQADIEHEIRIIQSRPAVNRIDADKAREEQLVSRLVQIVRLRDELVQQMEAERRRERQEDQAIAVSIASKRAQRNSDSISSSLKSGEVAATPKKSKVKDKMKKQFKKAKHTLIPKKKDDSKEPKEGTTKQEK